ncbi:c-type cytochrome [Bradyrhizobium sp.]|uniref:c-type cytochrome n=1 Tax=Bradyrhizobium sp. TaxID=376 RepID=UPI003C494A09
MLPNHGVRFSLVIPLAIATLFSIPLPHAAGATPASDSVSSGHHLAEAWCQACHAIAPGTAGTSNTAPDFAAIANQPSTTALSITVFLKTSHPTMPNLVITPEQADDLASYILSLKRN